jgi:2-phosphoglycerate kinase
MTTEDMPTTNQSSEEQSFAEKIPPAVAKGFEQAVSSISSGLEQIASKGIEDGLSQ